MSDDGAIVFVIDDDPAVREALDSLLRSVGMTVRTFASPAEFMKADRSATAACLVLDVRMPGANGLDFQNWLRENRIELPIIFITAHGDIRMSVRAIKAGAVEFLTKPFDDQQLIDAIGAALSSDRARRRVAAADVELGERFATLSAREREVMAHVVTGRLNKQIAGDLGLSEVTVKLHRGNVMRKMTAHSVADLVRMADRLAEVSGAPAPKAYAQQATRRNPETAG
jgi:FixJ family two-component response regulator